MNEYEKQRSKSVSDYDLQANDFLKVTNSKLIIKFIGLSSPNHWGENEKVRNTYEVSLYNSNGRDKPYVFKFWDSINATEKGTKPTAYDILACLNVDYCDNINDFCDCFGYDLMTDSIKETQRIKNIWALYEEEQDNLKRLYTEKEIELLNEIN
jgi:hypothetical protein